MHRRASRGLLFSVGRTAGIDRTRDWWREDGAFGKRKETGLGSPETTQGPTICQDRPIIRARLLWEMGKARADQWKRRA